MKRFISSFQGKSTILFILALFLICNSIVYAGPIYQYKYDANGNLLKVIKVNEDRSGYSPSPQLYKTFRHDLKLPISVPTVSQQEGAMTTVQFWMKWNGVDDVMPFTWNSGYNIWLNSGVLGFNTSNGDLYGVPVSNIENKWVLVTAVFSNGDVKKSRLFINGNEQKLQSYGTHAKISVSQEALVGGWERNDAYRYGGNLAGLKIWSTELSKGDILTYMQELNTPIQQGYLLGQWDIFDAPSASHSFKMNSRYMLDNLPVNKEPTGKTTVQFWMKWDGTSSQMPYSWDSTYTLFIQGHLFGFNTGKGDVYGTTSEPLQNKWVHVTAIFSNDNVYDSELYINGKKQSLTKYGEAAAPKVSDSAVISGWIQDRNYRFKGNLYQLKIWGRDLSESEINNEMFTANTTAEYVDFEMNGRG
ncbi:LamG domain-containing protein [Paenibacillus sp. UMB4589-SE434]|uniref:LamG domain-containing protein n=1 Tax=Paenibacillus sp. UMB4589-SE434 TaxID=3046314 RepID=UPI00254C505D|nr:LamG domain-containing protein [Paenibacillus sp. UMB4589-SE434]MDK8182636.1 LamG domain-containing protein [Paenibacillus sp. UMB4589-SE434]